MFSMLAEPPSSPRQGTPSPPVIDLTEDSPSPVARIHSEVEAAPTASDIPVPSASTRGGRGRGRGAIGPRGGSSAIRGRGGKKAGPTRDDTNIPTRASEPTTSDRNTAALGLIELSCASSTRSAGGAPANSTSVDLQPQKPVQQPGAPVMPSDVSAQPPKRARPAVTKAKPSYLATLDKPTNVDDSRNTSPQNLSQSAGPGQGRVPSTALASMRGQGLAAEATLGKHPRAQPDLVAQYHSRPTRFRKCQPKPQPRPQPKQAHDSPAGGSEAMERMNGYLAGVKAIMDSEAEQHRVVAASEEILAIQVNLLRERVRNFEQEKQALLDMQRRQLRPGLVTMKMTPRVQERVNQLFGPGGNGPRSSNRGSPAGPQTSKSIAELPNAPLPKNQIPMEADGSVPPMGLFRRSTGRQDSNGSSNRSSNRSSNMTLVASSEPEDDDGDATEESDVATESSWAPTESSWASTIPP
ncbi:hypothetical protein SLS64_008723 [Diaporthe eres]